MLGPGTPWRRWKTTAPRAPLREPITGWRVWNVSDDGPGPRLWPAGSGVDEWQPRHPVEARCGALRILTWGIGKHTAPDLRCRCGIYASRSLDVFERPRPAWPPTPVVGTVSLWGTVVEHERGWRGQFAYPARLRLVCAMCAWFEPGSGMPAVVHSFGKRVFTLCSAHRGGIQVPDGRRSVPTGTEPGYSNPDSSRRTRWTLFPKMPSVGCSSSRRPPIARACPRSASFRPGRNGAACDPRSGYPRVICTGAELHERRLRRTT